MNRCSSILTFILLVWAGSLPAQTNNFWYQLQQYFKFDQYGNYKSNVLNREPPFNYSSRFGISTWQGEPLLFSNGYEIYRYPDKRITNGLIGNISVHDNNFKGHYITTCDTSNYVMMYHNFSRRYSCYHNVPERGDFVYSYIKRDPSTETGFRVPEEKKNVVLPTNQILFGVSATRDSTGQPIFVARTRDYLYSYKTLKGGQIVKMDSMSAFYFNLTPDTVLTESLTNPFISVCWNFITEAALNHRGDKIVFSVDYNTIGYGFIIQNVSMLYQADFNKHTGKFSNLTVVQQHYWDRNMPQAPNNEYRRFYTFIFSPNDSFLYSNVVLLRYTEDLYSDKSNQNTYQEIISYEIIQIDLNNNFELQTIHSIDIASNDENSFQRIILNHKKEIYYTNSNVGELHKITDVNKKYPGCNVHKNIIPDNPDLSRNFSADIRYFTSHIFDFIRIKQEDINYTCIAEVNIKNISLPDIGFTKFKWHIINQNGELEVYEQLEPPELIYAHDGDFPIKLFAYSPKGGGYGEWYVDTIKIRIPDKPIAAFEASDTVICRYMSVAFTNLSQTHITNPATGLTYLWDFGDGNTSTDENPVHTYTQAGNHTVSLYFSNGYCDSFLVKTQYIRVIDAPKPGFEINSLQGCSPFTIHITDTATHEVEKKEYFFSDTDDWLEVTGTSFSYTFKQPGIYKVIQKLTGISGCEMVTDSVEVIVSKGITKQDTFDMLIADIRDKVIDLNWKGHPHATNYLIFRGTNLNNQQLHSQTKDTFWTDRQNTPAEYYYIVTGADSCGNTGTVGNYAKPVWLKVKMIGNNEAAELSYSDYEIWPGENKYYNIQKFNNGFWHTLIQNQQVEKYTDDDFVILDSLQSCYRIQTRDFNHTELVSHSNVVCLDYLPYLYIPNAFSPNSDGTNDFYSLSAVGIKEYRLQIYNRWGQKIFDGINLHWDGKANGELVPEGIYLAYVQYTTKDGKKFEYKTAVTLVR